MYVNMMVSLYKSYNHNVYLNDTICYVSRLIYITKSYVCILFYFSNSVHTIEHIRTLETSV